MKILFITLSNIGDVILTLPALDSLLAVYPKAEITVLCSERARGVFEGNFYIKKCIAYNKKAGFLERIKFLLELRKDCYDLIVDFRNSALPLLLKAKYKTYPWINAPADIVHMSGRHLYKVRPFIQPLYFSAKPGESGLATKNTLLPRKGLYISNSDRNAAANLLDEANIWAADKFILLGPGARSHIKRWPEVKFSRLMHMLAEELKVRAVIVGDEADKEVCRLLKEEMPLPVADLCARTSLKSLAAVIEKASLVISNDSAILHLASYLDRPTVALFGPTDYRKYGPWASRSQVVRSAIGCSPCQVARCKRGDLKCMDDIKVEEVYAAVKKLV